MPVTFIGITIPFVKNRAAQGCVLIAGASSLITVGMPYKLGLIVSALAGILTDWLWSMQRKSDFQSKETCYE